jgi:glycosyltransferase involved in cell wall biosynthesis
MRILQLSSARQLGGGERHFIDLSEGLRKRGHDLFLALTPDSPLLDRLSEISPEHVITLPLRNAIDISSAWRLRRFVREHRIEIVHGHVARDYPLAAIAAGAAGPARLVLTRHVMFPMSRLHRVTERRVARIIAVSEGVAASLRDERVFPEGKISLVRHGIHLAGYEPALSRSNDTGRLLRVGMLGEISPVKGQEDFARAAAEIAKFRDDVRFVMAGRDNSPERRNRRELDSLIKQLGLSDKLEVIESIDSIPQFMSDLDVFVSPSRSEAFGLAMVEAMACGVPVIATMTAGGREVVEDEKTGRLVPINKPAELARAITDLLANQDLRKMLGVNARRRVEEKFSLDRMISETEAVYREVLGEHHRGF